MRRTRRRTCAVPFLAAIVLALCMFAAATVATAQTASTQPPLKSVHVDLNDTAALRAGAMHFMHQCLACHSLQGARFQELAAALELTPEQIQSRINVSGLGLYDTITSPMPAQIATQYLGVAPPDLTNEAGLRGADWLYTYLTSFYVDPARPTGVNNVVFHNVAMPDVFAGLQGLQSPVTQSGYRNGQRMPIAVGVKPLTHGSLSAAEFDRMAKELVTFLYYISNPHEQRSHAIGVWVLAVIGLWTILAYWIYRLFWRDVTRPSGPRWWSR